MTEPATVSVVIPTYNSARFLAEAIESALRQSAPALEIIVVDDGSSDDTPEVLASFGDRILVHRQANAGVASARNAGIRLAQGSHIAFLDADDVWLPRKLEAQVAALATQPSSSLVHVGVLEVDERRNLLRQRTDGMAGEVAADIIQLRSVVLGGGSGLLVPRLLLEEIGGFTEALSTAADWDIFLRLALRGPIVFVEEPLLLYRFHGDQMHRNVAAMEHDLLHVLRRAFGELGMEPSLRRPAYAQAHRVLAGSFHETGNRRRAARHAAAAIWVRPRLLVDLSRSAIGRFRLSISGSRQQRRRDPPQDPRE